MAFEKFSGKTLEEALNLACQSKGVSKMNCIIRF